MHALLAGVPTFTGIQLATMHPEFVTALETRLRAERSELIERVRRHLHASDDPRQFALANHLNDVGDWTLADLMGDLDIAMLGHELSGLRDIDEALKRMASGTYGICSDCGRPISQERLTAQPAARLCLPCKELFERRRGIVSRVPL